MADGTQSYPIKVTFGVEIPGLTPAISDAFVTTVDALVQLQVDVPAPTNDKGGMKAGYVETRVMPDNVNEPLFLLVRPIKVGDADVKKADDLQWVTLEYATLNEAGEDVRARDRKPITGTHVFANGMAEWVADMVADGSPGPLTMLHFWNTTCVPVYEKNPDGSVKRDGAGKPVQERDGQGQPKTEPRPVKLLIVAGYSPAPVTPDVKARK